VTGEARGGRLGRRQQDIEIEHAAHQDSETKSQEFEGSREVNPRAILRVLRGTCMLQHTIKAVIRPGEQSGYVAECLEIPVVTQGRTLDEVTRNLQEAVALHLDGEDLAALGLAASPTVVVTMELQPTNA
jgi:predicted RNase H-like HicB family nuclease